MFAAGLNVPIHIRRLLLGIAQSITKQLMVSTNRSGALKPPFTWHEPNQYGNGQRKKSYSQLYLLSVGSTNNMRP